jgi:hypothetical protein
VTPSEFFDAVAKLEVFGYRPFVQNVRTHMKIRLSSLAGHVHCPITAVAETKLGEIYHPNCVNSAAAALGISKDLRERIVLASDFNLDTYKFFRKQLLEIFGLL